MSPIPVALLALTIGITQDDGALLTSLVAAAAGKDARLDVLTHEDVRKAVALEAEQQSVGCSTEGSCLAELAGALGARAIIYGSVGTLGDTRILTLSLYDSAQGRSGGREVVKGRTIDELAAGLDAAVVNLIGSWQKANPTAEGERARLLVMDLDVRSSTNPEPADAPLAADTPNGRGPILWVGAGTAGLGVAGVIAGVIMDRMAASIHDEVTADKSLSASEANARFDSRDALSIGGVTAMCVGSAVALIGGGIIAFSFME
jgi:hypothetical protein